MRLTKQQKEKLTPFGKWLLEYVQEQDTNLTALATEVGLSNNSLRAFILYPERIPKLETCLLLAKATRKDPEEVIHLAGLKLPKVALQMLDPNRIKLIRIFDNLQPHLQRALLETAEAIKTSDHNNKESEQQEI